MNILKLLQETKGLAEIMVQRPKPRVPVLLALQMNARFGRSRQMKPKLALPIDMKELPDIPHPVAIRHLVPAETSISPSLA